MNWPASFKKPRREIVTCDKARVPLVTKSSRLTMPSGFSLELASSSFLDIAISFSSQSDKVSLPAFLHLIQVLIHEQRE